ncbi:hypothetical protein CCO03_18030 [Comamonas serinivorans]|uniref:Uncharacterized protein n=1 Tax=Comamonas serinivorans TaxID=1082851 RepID=A0A1Y0ESG9_9BURK|nr:hypothetical protein [Comamonas serinivorans]ARU06321.1 hypothetical protein CCO03_18030 [Comamonas serinivorans]
MQREARSARSLLGLLLAFALPIVGASVLDLPIDAWPMADAAVLTGLGVLGGLCAVAGAPGLAQPRGSQRWPQVANRTGPTPRRPMNPIAPRRTPHRHAADGLNPAIRQCPRCPSQTEQAP